MSSPTPESPLSPISIRLSALSGYLSAPGALEGVGFWPRVGARLIDLVAHYCASFCGGILFVMMLVLAAGGHVSPLILARLQHAGVVGFGFAILGSITYEAICESVHGSTLGKLILSMVVVQEDGSPCRAWPALTRSFAYLIDSLFFGLVGYSSMEKTPQQQRLGDQWAQTIVCKRTAVAQENLRGPGLFIVAMLFALMADAALAMIGLLLKLNG